METSGGIQASLSGRYAVALFDLARDAQSLDTVAGSLAALKAALAEEDERIWRAAGYALGKAKVTGAQSLEVFNEQRLE